MIDEDALKSIERLHQMNADGVISAEEFERSKERILFGAQKQKVAGVAAGPVGQPVAGDYVAWATLPFKKYADFSGRASRKEYWLFYLLVAIIILACVIFGAMISDDAAVGMYLLGSLGVIVPLLAAQVRRFHDQNKSGLLALLNLIPIAGSLVVLIFMLFDGTSGPNRFGPDPKERQP